MFFISTGQGFLQARDALRKFADNKEFEAGVSYEGMSTPEREAKIQLARKKKKSGQSFGELLFMVSFKLGKSTRRHSE